jgi:hypothetical protein
MICNAAASVRQALPGWGQSHAQSLQRLAGGVSESHGAFPFVASVYDFEDQDVETGLELSFRDGALVRRKRARDGGAIHLFAIEVDHGLVVAADGRSGHVHVEGVVH